MPPRSSILQVAASFFHDALEELAPHESDGPFRAAVDAGWRPDEPGMWCSRCGADSRPNAYVVGGCRICRGTRLPWEKVVRVGAYAEPIEEWIRQMKFRHAWTWTERLGELLADAMRKENPGKGAILSPVPMHWRRRHQRGFNQSDLIARTIGKRLSLPVVDLLRRIRYTEPQSAVPDSARRANVARSFSIRRVDLTGYEIWLVDDVKTSGATLKVCSRLLRAQGAKVNLAVVAVARSGPDRFA